MRNAALTLGVIAGIVGMLVGFFAYGYTAVVEQWGEVDGVLTQVQDVHTLRLVAIVAPVLAIAGGAMARSQALLGGILMGGSALGMYLGLGFNVFTMFPIVFAATAAVLALAAGRPDEPRAHF
ncbi:hypothetical protein [Chachezhania sediminis]|uniref:hypothetical protein n=1 Tax=Chachezhania sediminis TaxID=2599291 RepID=UPI00131E811E|nr:hypothetical protein [Chachezhania sediminis]